MTAGVAPVYVTTKSGGSANLDCPYYPKVLDWNRTVLLVIGSTVPVQNVRNLQSRSGHYFYYASVEGKESNGLLVRCILWAAT